jgi:hypothetical protein
MVFRRAGFALTPPSMAVFVISLVLAAIAILTNYGVVRIAAIGSGRAFLAIAYVALVAGVVLRRL